MIVERDNNDIYYIIVGDSDISEVVIKLKREAATALRDKLNDVLSPQLRECYVG